MPEIAIFWKVCSCLLLKIKILGLQRNEVWEGIGNNWRRNRRNVSFRAVENFFTKSVILLSGVAKKL